MCMFCLSVTGNEKAALEKPGGKSRGVVTEAPVSMLMFYCWMALVTFIVIIGFTALRNRHRVRTHNKSLFPMEYGISIMITIFPAIFKQNYD